MNGPRAPERQLEDLFEEAPCGYLTSDLDGRIVRANRTFQTWTGYAQPELVGRRFQELLSQGARIYYETHFAPLLQMHGRVSEIALDVVRADGSRMSTLVNATISPGLDDPRMRTVVFDATDRRRYEEELMRSRTREEGIARELQAGLLAGALPAAADVQVDIVYRPAVTGLAVGGDWYDAFWLEEGRSLALVVGDVVGRGIPAAAAMGQLRSAVRAIAADASGPAAVLDGVERYARRHDVGRYCTVAYGQLVLPSGEFTYACAGHPPPMVLPPDGDPVLLWAGRSPPLDAARGVRRRSEGHWSLARGTTVLFFSDGLIERRGEPLDTGLARLGSAAHDLRDLDLARFTQATSDRMAGDDDADDVCLLAMRYGLDGGLSTPPGREL
ncbi:SpoIIE family protein phosphatase [Paraconexibacter antarcticus]|uniref:SpoIIE family protein phosphatase n=1 Tax=Paraconexibacter antarcticus TaxID=2949664 RepID=A0ABY5DQY6_9ACTN|nr:SpoIIE family protein phosphatase [Paraconexibacter antarcticus]UTI63314.1 SpoIIE family protein phosphatase [Paraconexibacter antarcticus]